MHLVIRLWDTYISELSNLSGSSSSNQGPGPSTNIGGFPGFLVFFSSSFLTHFSKSHLLNKQKLPAFEDVLLFLQQGMLEEINRTWEVGDLECVLARCEVERQQFAGSVDLRGELERILAG